MPGSRLELGPGEYLARGAIPPSDPPFEVDLHDARGRRVHKNSQSSFTALNLSTEFRGAEGRGGHLGDQRQDFPIFIEELAAVSSNSQNTEGLVSSLEHGGDEPITFDPRHEGATRTRHVAHGRELVRADADR